MYKIGLIGNYGSDSDLADGQTIKTEIVSSEIMRNIGESQIIKWNTCGSFFSLFKIPFVLLKYLALCRNIVIFPAQNGVKIIAPFLSFFNIFFNKNLHYVVIGGWLPEFLANRCLLSRMLKGFNWIYVETEIMKKKMNDLGFQNTCVMPNFKNIQVSTEIKCIKNKPFKFCTFSRVMKEKGIEDAINAIKLVTETYGKKCTLDIYGKIDSQQIEWFENLKKNFPLYIKYKGIISFQDSTNVLKNYYGLLFPTYYDGEGFAGTLLDAFAAGIPVIASDWHFNAELVENGKEGFLCRVHDVDDLSKKICLLIDSEKGWSSYSRNCIDKAKRYIPSEVIKILLSKLG